MVDTRAPLTSRLSPSALLAIVRDGALSVSQSRIAAGLSASLPPLLERFRINTPLRLAHFLSQIAHESDRFRTLEEYASGSAYERRQDLGNTKPGDGVRFKGRTPMQITGRANYRNLTAWLKSAGVDCPDFEAAPAELAESQWAAWACVWYWDTRGLNKIADRDDLVLVTKVINGGRRGLKDRALLLARAKSMIAGLQAADLTAARRPVLRRGNEGEKVAELQRSLHAAGVYRGTIDASFGPLTEDAVKVFQKVHGLAADGIFGPATAAVLSQLQPEPAEIEK